MANTDERQPANDQVTQPNNSWRTRFVSYIKSQLQQRKAKKEQETPTDRAARLTAAATVWMAVFTFILAGTSGFTIWILKNQLREMHEGGMQTDSIITADERIARAMEDSIGQAKASFDDWDHWMNWNCERLRAIGAVFGFEWLYSETASQQRQGG